MVNAIEIYKNAFIHRYDDNGYLKYFCADDFTGLNAKKYSFKSNGNILNGYFYYYDGCKEDSLVIFCHGIGGGHRSYMMEIETICKRGYKVLSFDNTGCFDSEGDSIICLGESLIDLNNAISSLTNDGIISENIKLMLVGHSWGAYAVTNIENYKSNIYKIVSISAFCAVSNFLKYYNEFDKLESKDELIKKMLEYEKEKSGEFFNSTSMNAMIRASKGVLLSSCE